MSTHTEAPLDIMLLGPLHLAVGSEAAHISSRKAQWLLALLALRSGREVTRQWLAETLWPDNDEQQALFNLRQCLPHLRKALGAESHRISSPTPRTLCLDLAGASVDVAAFDSSIAAGDFAALDRAVGLYRGPLLEGCSEEWIVADRRSREEAYLLALERLGQHALAAGRFSESAGYFRRLVAADPYRESAYGALMQALGASGDAAAVTQTYRELRKLLRSELQTAPSAETQALFDQLRTRTGEAPTGSRAEPAPRASAQPPIQASASTRVTNNLPRQFTRFVGRDLDKSEITCMIAAGSLVTLIGPGGTGKTRLALETAADLLEAFPDGVWLVEFAALSASALAIRAVADVLGVGDDPAQPLLTALIEVLRSSRLLLILDNCEHIIQACADLASALLRSCPMISLLATSQQALHITGEAVYRVPSLSLPDLLDGSKELLETASLSEAVRLFVERADAVRPPFKLNEENVQAVVRICRRLDGIPLALELAAARTGSLTVAQIAQRLEDRFRLLTGGSRDTMPRHRTLQGLIDWSYDLLSNEERLLFQRLSIFAGGWTLEAAEMVAADAMACVEAWEIPDLLSELVEKSLVLFEVTVRGDGRYRFLETVREYALNKLKESAERDAVIRRHRDFYLTLAESVKPKLNGPEQAVWLDTLELEHENIRLALAYCEEAPGHLEKGLRLAAALQVFWWMRGPLSEGKAHYTTLLEHPDAQKVSMARADALHGAGGVASLQGDHSLARELWESCLADRKELGDRQGQAYALSSLAMTATDLGDPSAAKKLYSECMALQTELGEKRGRAFSLSGLAQLAVIDGDYIAGNALYAESLDLHRQIGNARGVATVLGDLGGVARLQGDYTEAQALLTEGIALQRELGNRTGIAVLLFYLATTATDLQDYAEARQRFAECLTMQQEQGNRVDISATLEAFAVLLTRIGDPVRAAKLWGAAEAFRESCNSPRPANEQEEYQRDIGTARCAALDGAFNAAWLEGRAMTVEQAVDCALGS